ncbi:MAG: bifunctional N-acetylglucosamine-1-phosphate uridyltransferase/glucosamine-1-phosphate acetyltransferase [Bdellovibrionales bacterium]|nr:bifunctional N-acetylglucosamine-1-phosphate uridyltransferase/glucosamine-1-phosphate acetyltransferase [Bdellovibrionales bacterium]
MQNHQNSQRLGVLILAAGKGTRMESEMPKVLHKVAGQAMLSYVIDAAAGLHPDQLVIVVGHEAQTIQDHYKEDSRMTWALQKELRGTGDAVRSAADQFESFEGDVLVLCGDTPGIRAETLYRLMMVHRTSGFDITLLTAEFDDPTGYGRIIVNPDGSVQGIVEEKDANAHEKMIDEINTGIAVYRSAALFNYLDKLKPTNKQKEFYLTDLVSICRSQGLSVGRMQIKDPTEAIGVNDREALAESARCLYEDYASKLMKSGVTLEDPTTIIVEPQANIESDSVIEASVCIREHSQIGASVLVGSLSQIRQSKIGDGSRIGVGCVCNEVHIEEKVQIQSHCILGTEG